MKKFTICIYIIIAASVYAQQHETPQKFALVIGNGAYTGLARLNNPVNDANDMTAALRNLGFTVDIVLDGNLDQMESAIIRLKNRLSVSKNSYGFFFYAGHGVQSGGGNFLIPAGANIPSENFLRDRAISVQTMLHELNDAGNELNVIVLDACRDNPFSWARSGTRGLSVVANQPADSIIVYATSAGSVASDGTGRNGLFTSQLLKNLQTPELEITEVLRLTGADVARQSNRRQIPAVYNQFFGRAYLGSRPVATPPIAAIPVPAPERPASVQTVVQSAPERPAPIQPAAPPQRPVPDTVSGPLVLIKGGTFAMGVIEKKSLEEKNPPEINSSEKNFNFNHSSSTSPPVATATATAPSPSRTVTVRSFYMGKYELTQKEYRDVMGANPSRIQENRLPVDQVSWFDAIEYCNRRSLREGLTPAYTIANSDGNLTVDWNRDANGYRLPTEAEWEYSCRAGTSTKYCFGDTIKLSQARYYVKGANQPQRANDVGSFEANPWGLHDMHGNVREWCWEWYGSYTEKAQIDPIGWNYGSKRVIRGGAWNRFRIEATSSYRWSNNPLYRDYCTGFRVARNE